MCTSLVSFLLDEPFQIMQDIQVHTLDLTPWGDYLNVWDSSMLTPNPDDFTELERGGYSLDESLALDTLSTIEPHPARFTGDVSVLTSAANASGATNIIAKLVDAGRVTTIGEPTGGSAEGPTAGVILFLQLPNSGITVRVPLYRQYNAVTSFEPGLGITPDVIVRPTIDDVLSGRDAVLEAAYNNG